MSQKEIQDIKIGDLVLGDYVCGIESNSQSYEPVYITLKLTCRNTFDNYYVSAYANELILVSE